MDSHRAAVAHLAALALSIFLLTGCGPATTASNSPSPSRAASPLNPSPSPAPSAAPSPSASPSPAPVTGAYGVLVSPLAGATYTVSIVGVDGKVVASAQASSPAAVTCANTAAAVVPPPVSTTNSRVYFLDAQGVVHYLSPSGDGGQATTLPVGASSRAMFAVSPDDARIAVIVANFNSTGASTRMYVEDLNGGGHHIDTYSESGSYTLWPIGWHDTGNLVVAKVPACTQGGGPLCCGPQELHVVDPNTAVRRFTLGGSQCVVAGAASPAGVVCESSTFTQATVLSWTAAPQRTIAVQGPTPAYLSPNGTQVAIVDFGAGTTAVNGVNRSLAMQACGWIDDTHLLAGGDAQTQPRVGDITTGALVPVAAQGDCGGRLPGGL